MSKAKEKYWVVLTEEEKYKRMQTFREAGVKAAAEVNHTKHAEMTKEEKVEHYKSWVQAGHEAARASEIRQKANKTRWGKKTKEEILHDTKRFREAGRLARQYANPSSIERLIWEELDKLKVKYQIQVLFNHGKFIVDIYIPSKRIMIECNGTYWHGLKARIERDKELQKFADKNGYKVMWLWETEIRKNPKQALEKGFKDLVY